MLVYADSMNDWVVELLPQPRPLAFRLLPASEMRWRGRLWLMAWTGYGDAPYAWFAALADEPDYIRAMRELVAATPDARILAAFQAAWAERGRW